MAYNNDTEQITAPVSIKDLQQCFGLSDTDLGTLITKANINKWAKYKPVDYPQLLDTTGQLEANKTWKSSATWWKCRDGSCGFDIAIESDYKYAIGKDVGWNYKRPIGGIVSPFRLQDFNQYNKEVSCPYGFNGIRDEYIISTGTTPSYFTISMTYYDESDSENNAYRIQPNDVRLGNNDAYRVSNMFLTCCIKNLSTGDVVFFQSIDALPVEDGDSAVIRIPQNTGDNTFNISNKLGLSNVTSNTQLEMSVFIAPRLVDAIIVTGTDTYRSAIAPSVSISAKMQDTWVITKIVQVSYSTSPTLSYNVTFSDVVYQFTESTFSLTSLKVRLTRISGNNPSSLDCRVIVYAKEKNEDYPLYAIEYYAVQNAGGTEVFSISTTTITTIQGYGICNLSDERDITKEYDFHIYLQPTGSYGTQLNGEFRATMYYDSVERIWKLR